ncbi:hypothetical protein ACRARG_11595 [Pseudooceanicola sp. C21-150M6]|uniref:hypothetical protein n=1 Tax=Pseudooceanicola sp. C21-150M6 TaxID=3434355 RepID=UPI003D7F18FB
MSRPVSIYLEPPLLKSARAGEHNFISKLSETLASAGHDVIYRPEEEVGTHPQSLAITHMRPPPIGGVTFRRVYHYPFWQIETTAERWYWHTTKATFSAETVPDMEATRFYAFWQKRLFGEGPYNTRRDGFVYVPLQGRLSEHRSFQSCTPLDMLRTVLSADPGRNVVATLHPNEVYAPDDVQYLEELARQTPRLSVITGNMEQLLQTCDYVVSMNSAAAFSGYFFAKPCILFAKIDFHHIALQATPDDTAAFDRIASHHPPFAKYVWWFWQQMSINAGRPEALTAIAAALRRCGWDI